MKKKYYKVGNYKLDKEQTSIVYDNSKHLLVVAGAGSGKTLTILGKIKYLIEEKNIKEKEILCISFTKAASESLKNKIKLELGYNIQVYTFHSLGLSILKNNYNYDICDEYLLSNIINEFFEIDIKNNKYIEKYFKKNNDLILNYKKTLETFLKLFKSSGYSLNDFVPILNKSKSILNIKYWNEDKIFLTIALNIYIKYETYLKENNEIDFDDMLIKASDIIKRNGYNKSIKYIVIDEFQDTSQIRFNLIQEILNKTNASLMAVGDDFQSIYHFTGCNLDLFLNFNRIFKDASIKKIQTTYRNSQELVTIAGKFIMKNKKQIHKNLKSGKSIKNPIEFIYYNDRYQEFENLINKLPNNILVLGRNNNDINYFIDKKKFKLVNDKIIYLNNPSINIKYLTIHKSKGLEEDNVILINLSNSITGFPSKLVDDRKLRYVLKKNKYPYEEERRLMYVALTRTKNKIYLMVPKRNESIFIRELKSL